MYWISELGMVCCCGLSAVGSGDAEAVIRGIVRKGDEMGGEVTGVPWVVFVDVHVCRCVCGGEGGGGV